ncbi:MAG: LytTR family DNA-binding domain-containing protein [Taibaiella sp.]|jgi:two-component system LytT family response regulator
MKTVIIEDEPQVAETLKLLVNKYCPDVTIVGSAASFSEGYELCHSLQPELVFCDVQLHSEEGTGLQLMQLMGDRDMKIIFVTGSKEYAADAFRVNAIDYLLKPINIKELIEAVDKALQSTEVIIAPRTINNLHIPTQHGFLIVPLTDVIRCQADGPYTHFYISKQQGRKTSAANLGLIAERLPATDFFRVHKTHIVNKAHVVEYIRGEGGMARMTDNSEVPISRLAKDAFMQWLG